VGRKLNAFTIHSSWFSNEDGVYLQNVLLLSFLKQSFLTKGGGGRTLGTPHLDQLLLDSFTNTEVPVKCYRSRSG
jgi:hypothetical protein